MTLSTRSTLLSVVLIATFLIGSLAPVDAQSGFDGRMERADHNGRRATVIPLIAMDRESSAEDPVRGGNRGRSVRARRPGRTRDGEPPPRPTRAPALPEVSPATAGLAPGQANRQRRHAAADGRLSAVRILADRHLTGDANRMGGQEAKCNHHGAQGVFSPIYPLTASGLAW
jgi:hypothetical protein